MNRMVGVIVGCCALISSPLLSPLSAAQSPTRNAPFAPVFAMQSYASNYTNLNILVDQVLSADSSSWSYRYIRGTVTGAYVKYRSSDGRRATIRARYTYGSQRFSDWVEIRLQDGQAQCVEYGSTTDFEGCKKIGGMGIGQMAAVGAALAVAAGAASAASGSGSDSSSTYTPRNQKRCDPSDYYIDNNGYARPAC